MAKHTNSIKNLLPNGKETHSKVHIKGWSKRRNKDWDKENA